MIRIFRMMAVILIPLALAGCLNSGSVACKTDINGDWVVQSMNGLDGKIGTEYSIRLHRGSGYLLIMEKSYYGLPVITYRAKVVEDNSRGVVLHLRQAVADTEETEGTFVRYSVNSNGTLMASYPGVKMILGPKP